MPIRYFKRIIPAVLMAIVASACRQQIIVTLIPSPTPLPPTATSTPFKTIVDVPTPTPTANAQIDFSGVKFFYDPSLGAMYGAGYPDDDDSTGAPQWRLPARLVFSGVNYPLEKSNIQPTIMIVPIASLAGFNPEAVKRVTDLQAILKDKPAGDAIKGELPQLADLVDAQTFIAQVKYLDFKGGSGVRFISQYSNDVRPINNADMVYQFEGITSDGKYLVSILLPLSQKDLVKDEDSITDEQAAAIVADINKYVADTAATLDKADAGTFKPDLGVLDQLVASVEVSANVSFDITATQPAEIPTDEAVPEDPGDATPTAP